MRRSRLSNPELITLLTSPGWSRCEGIIKSFEDAWQQGPPPAIADYLQVDEPIRHALLLELVHIDLEFRLKAGEDVRIETWLQAHPELAANHRATLELLTAEFELRQRVRGSVNLDEYRERFPHLVEELFNRLPQGDVDTTGPWGQTSAEAKREKPAVPGYEIQDEIGRGGMGIVYKARDPNLDRHVALKFLPTEYARHPERLQRFLHEARTASALNHPQICTVHALGEHEGRPYIVMEYIEGITLKKLAERRPTVEEVSRLIGQAARALTAAHAAGVVHRDIKPDNIMVREDGYVKVLDFGLARRLPTLAAPLPAEGPDTDPGTLLGTVAFMSPEQARGDPAESAADIFSLGIVLYQLLTGEHPFQGESALGTLYAITTRQPLPAARLNPEIPAGLERLIEAMLHKDDRLRPTAAEVEAALTASTGPVSGQEAQTGPDRPIIHREPELAALRTAFAGALAGRGSLLCVVGEAGIGKTTLVEDFLQELAAPGRPCLIARGHCSERLASTEAYLPVLDALAGLLRSETTGSIARLLKVVAPSWYAQLAAGQQAIPLEAAAAPATSQPAMLREFANLLLEAARRAPVVLFIDDVHWADLSTVDLLGHLGRYGQTLRLLVIVTYRPTEMLLGPHPFHRIKLELQGKGVCTELPIGFLSRADVVHYLDLAFPNHTFRPDFADLIHARTEGSPLFMADLLRYLCERGVVAERGGRWTLAQTLPDLSRELPESVRGLIARKLERLDDLDVRLLSAASVQGQEFDSAVIAGALQRDAADVEERLQELDRVHGLVRLVRETEFPDRTLTLRYSFVHVLYQQAFFANLLPSRRAALGAALARELEQHHDAGSAASAAELAYLYEVGRDFERAAEQCWRAARNAARVFAHREAVALARQGVRLLEMLPETPDRGDLELPLQTFLGLQLQITDGFAAPAAKEAYQRARLLCQSNPGSPALFPVLWGLWLFSKVRSELSRAHELAGELRALAQALNAPPLALQAQQALAVTALCRGEPYATLRHLELGTTLYDAERHRTHSNVFGQDPGVALRSFGSIALWLMGFPEEALRQSREAMRLSHQLWQPSSQALALHFAALLHQLCRDGDSALVCAETSGVIAAEHGFSFWMAGSAVVSGWALVQRGDTVPGLKRLQQGLQDWETTGSVTYRTWYLGLLAEALQRQGNIPTALQVLDDALQLVERTGEGLYEAELYRLRGELRLALQSHLENNAEADFRRALDVARQQGAKSLELRAALSLTRLDRRLNRAGDGRTLLGAIYQRFTEGFKTADLLEAERELQ